MITPISKQIKCISPQVRSVYNPAGDVVSRPRLLLRGREVVNLNRTRQIFEIRSWSAAVTPGIAAREASAMADIHFSYMHWVPIQLTLPLPTVQQRAAVVHSALQRT